MATTNFPFFLLSALLFSLNFFIFAEVKIAERKNSEGNSLPCLRENFEVIGCCKQYQMVTRLQPVVAFVATGGTHDFLAPCRHVIIWTEPIRVAEEIQDLGCAIP